jgi:L,D-transpeptidase YcbB
MLRISVLFLVTIVFFASCEERKRIGEKQLVQKPAEINESATEIIQGSLSDFLQGNHPLSDFKDVKNVEHIKKIYAQHNYLPLWTSEGKWTKGGDSLFALISEAPYYGLFPNDYFHSRISDLRNKLITDTASKENKLDAALWAETDLYLSLAFVQLIKDLKIGRITDSVTIKKDSLLNTEFLVREVKSFQASENNSSFVADLEPKHLPYQHLKRALHSFLPAADFKAYTYINPKDSLNLQSLLRQRLAEDSIKIDSSLADSLALAKAIRQYQKRKGLKQDGKINTGIISRLNETDTEKFIRIAITLDRYKQLPDSLPNQYIWVNIPGYYMFLEDNDTIRVRSKVVVGTPKTRTPILSSSITDMITYPQWTIPESIIKKDILPGLKKDPSYTRKKGFSLIDKDGNEVDPFFVNWSKYEKGIPYKVVQGSGDDNALGVIKFNFSNKYSVYLHDTNQRYLFAKKSRALSHGCVRVQNWDSLAYFILKNDSIAGAKYLPVDTLKTWLSFKEKHVIPVRKRIPLYIRYFTCEAKNDDIVFYEDVYGEDRRLKEKFFANKNL